MGWEQTRPPRWNPPPLRSQRESTPTPSLTSRPSRRSSPRPQTQMLRTMVRASLWPAGTRCPCPVATPCPATCRCSCQPTPALSSSVPRPWTRKVALLLLSRTAGNGCLLFLRPAVLGVRLEPPEQTEMESPVHLLLAEAAGTCRLCCGPRCPGLLRVQHCPPSAKCSVFYSEQTP